MCGVPQRTCKRPKAAGQEVVDSRGERQTRDTVVPVPPNCPTALTNTRMAITGAIHAAPSAAPADSPASASPFNSLISSPAAAGRAERLCTPNRRRLRTPRSAILPRGMVRAGSRISDAIMAAISTPESPIGDVRPEVDGVPNSTSAARELAWRNRVWRPLVRRAQPGRHPAASRRCADVLRPFPKVDATHIGAESDPDRGQLRQPARRIDCPRGRRTWGPSA